MILLFLLPFYDRSPERRPERRPVATITGIAVIAAMAFLTYSGANAGSPTAIEMKTPQSVLSAGGKTLAEYEAGKRVVAQSGCLACHKIGDNGNDGPGPAADQDRRAPAAPGNRAHAGQPDGADAVVQEPAAEEVQRGRRLPVAAQVASRDGLRSRHRLRVGSSGGGAGALDVRPHRRRLRPAEHGDDGRPAPSLALARGRPGARRAGRPRARRRHGHRRLGARAGRAGGPRRRGDRQRLRRGHARPRAREGSRCEAGGLSAGPPPACARASSGRDALALQYADGAFDAATVGFGARNFADLSRGLAEMARVVRPGGRVVVLEITTPVRPPLSTSTRCGSTASCRCSGARRRRPRAS